MSVFKPLEGIQAAIKEVYQYLLGVSIEAGKQTKPAKGINVKGYLFLWPFVIALIIVLYLLARVFIVD